MAKKTASKLSLESIGDQPPAEAGRKTPEVRNEIDQWERAKQENDAQHERLMNRLKRGAYRQLYEQRKEYAGKLFQLVVMWLFALVTIVFISGWDGRRFRVSDSIILAMLGGTTITVLGLFTFVAKYLFPDPATKSRQRSANSTSRRTRQR